MEGESPGVWAPRVAGAPAGVKGNSYCPNEIALGCMLAHLFGKHLPIALRTVGCIFFKHFSCQNGEKIACVET